MFSLCEATKMVSSQAPLWRSLNCSRARRDAGAWVRAWWLVSGQSLFRSAQPRKLCVEDGNGFGGGFPGHSQARIPWGRGCGGRRHWRFRRLDAVRARSDRLRLVPEAARRCAGTGTVYSRTSIPPQKQRGILSSRQLRSSPTTPQSLEPRLGPSMAVLSLAVNHSSMDASVGPEKQVRTPDCGSETRRARPARICPFPNQHSEQLMSTVRCRDLPPSRLPLLLDRDHFRGCPKFGCPIPQVDYHALISEREDRYLAWLFCPGWSRENGHFICHGTPRYLSRRADRGALKTLFSSSAEP
jgi:hypothetical protein